MLYELYRQKTQCSVVKPLSHCSLKIEEGDEKDFPLLSSSSLFNHITNSNHVF